MRSLLSGSFYSSALNIECFQNEVLIKASEVMQKKVMTFLGHSSSSTSVSASQASKNSSMVLA